MGKPGIGEEAQGKRGSTRGGHKAGCCVHRPERDNDGVGTASARCPRCHSREATRLTLRHFARGEGVEVRAGRSGPAVREAEAGWRREMIEVAPDKKAAAPDTRLEKEAAAGFKDGGIDSGRGPGDTLEEGERAGPRSRPKKRQECGQGMRWAQTAGSRFQGASPLRPTEGIGVTSWQRSELGRGTGCGGHAHTGVGPMKSADRPPRRNEGRRLPGPARTIGDPAPETRRELIADPQAAGNPRPSCRGGRCGTAQASAEEKRRAPQPLQLPDRGA